MITVKNLTRIYKLGNVDVVGIKNVTFTIKKGDMITIMGKSGSGKSTLLRLIGLLDRPTSGKITINGHNVVNLNDSKRAKFRLSKLGYIFQEFALLPELTALENVYLPGMMYSAKNVNYKKRAKELLEIVGLKDRLNHKPKELSGGEQQRVAIARSLINNPSFLFADEPCANLDTISSKTIMNTFVKLNSELNVTVIFVSHDPDDKKYAKRQIFLKDGRMVKPYF